MEFLIVPIVNPDGYAVSCLILYVIGFIITHCSTLGLLIVSGEKTESKILIHIVLELI